MKLRMVILILGLSALTACGDGAVSGPEPVADETANPPAGTRENPFVGHGFIEEIRDGELLIRHDAIPGFMPAMTMAFPVSDDVSVDDLAVGDEITFDLERLEPDRTRVFRVELVE